MTDHNPFNHLRELSWFIDEQDSLARLALLELIDQLDLDPNPYFTALESSTFQARLTLAVYSQFFKEYQSHQDTENENDENAVRDTVTAIKAAVEENITTHRSFYGPEVFNFSLPDMNAIIDACDGAWSDEEILEIKKGLYNRTSSAQEYQDKWWAIMQRPAAAMSEHFTLRIHNMNQPAVILHVGKKDPYPLHARAITANIGPYHMTWRACKEWGLTLPKHSWFADNNEVACELVFPDIPDNIRLNIVSTEDSVPDPDNPGQFKNEKFKVVLEKDKITALSFTNRGLKYHDWRVVAKEDDA